MKIQAIRLRHVKKIGASGLALEGLSSGLNVLSEPNEFGKSTIFEAFRHGLLTKHSSKKDEVRNLLPRLGGGAPLVEIDIAIENKSYRIRKQFLSQSSTLITDLGTGIVIKSADDAQEWIKQAIGADEKHSGPAGLLWVSQGQSFLPAAQTEAEQEVFSSVLDNEVTSVVSGQRGRQVMSRVKAQLSELVTKTGRPAKAYKAAEDTLKALDLKKQDLTDKMTQADTALTRLASLAGEIKAAQDAGRTAELTQELKAAETEHQKALQAEPKLEQLKSEARNQSHAFVRAAQDQKDFERATSRGQTLQNQIKDVQTQLTGAKETLEQKEERLAELSRARKETEGEKSRTELAYRQAVTSEGAETAKQNLQRSQTRLERALELRETIENKNALLAGMLIDPAALQDLKDLESQVRVLEASQSKGQTQFKIDYESDASQKIWLGDKTIEGAKSYVVPKRISLIVPGVGVLHIEPAPHEAGESRAQALQEANRAYTGRLAKLGAGSLDEAIAAQRSRAGVKQEIDDAKLDLARNAPDGIEALKAGINTLIEQAKESRDDALSPAEAQNALDQAGAAHVRALAEEKAALETVNSLRQSCASLETEAGGLTRELQSLIAEIGSPDIWAVQKETLQTSLNRLETQSTDAQDAYDTFKEAAPPLELTHASLERCKTAVANRAKRANDLIFESEGLKGQLLSLAADGIEEELAVVSGEIIRASESAARFEAEVSALNLLRETLEEKQSTEKAQLFGPVVKELKMLMPQVIKGADVRLGDDYAASEIIRDGQVEDVNSLSGGTQEQIAILTRLAFARLKARQGHPTPVILDDAIIFSDDARISGMFTALNVVANDLQILVLTCRQKSFEGLGGHLLSGRPWPE